jgi:ribonuclease Z
LLTLTFLGTSAARPTVERSVSSIALEREGETLLFDCGEGTQRQMMRYGVGFSLSEIFFTHFHADHYLGLPGLIRTFGLQGRTEKLTLYGPHGAKRALGAAVELGFDRWPFEVEVREVKAGEVLERSGYAIEVVHADHGGPAVGYALREAERLGRFDPERAKALGVPEGPLWGKLHRGETVEVDGKKIGSKDLVGPPRPGRLVVISGDTAPCKEMIAAAKGADLLVHEATFGDEEAERAAETKHSTARQAAEVARKAGVKRLVLTHLSARYSVATEGLVAEAREVFPATEIARDGMVVDVPFADA